MTDANPPPVNSPSPSVGVEPTPTLLGHPPGLFVLFCVEMWERFSYYGMRALLVLYLIAKVDHRNADGFTNPGRGWEEGPANVLYGWYVGLVYLTPLIGGIIADKLIGTHRSMVLGGIIIALGHIVLAVSGLGELAHNETGMSLFVFGLALIVLGTGHFKPCVSVMVGQLYKEKDPRLDGAFSIFYMGINLGAFLCAFVCGTLGQQVGWHWGFGSAAVGMIAGLATYLILRPRFLAGVGEAPSPSAASYSWIGLPIAVIGAGAVTLLYSTGVFGSVQAFFNKLPTWLSHGILIAMVGMVVVSAVLFVLKQEAKDRGPTASIFIFLAFNIFFWLAFEQAGSSMNVFAEEKTNRIVYGREIPATWLQSVNPGVILLLGAVFAGMWTWLSQRRMNPSQPAKIGIALILLGIGFGILTWGAASAEASGGKVSLLLLVWVYIFHTLGELCISPTGLSYVTKAAPVRFVSLLMGIWLVSNFVAGLAGGLIASRVEAIERGEIKLPWHFGGQADFFFLFVVTSFSSGLLILALTPWLRPLTAGRDA